MVENRKIQSPHTDRKTKMCVYESVCACERERKRNETKKKAKKRKGKTLSAVAATLTQSKEVAGLILWPIQRLVCSLHHWCAIIRIIIMMHFRVLI